jgi:tetratricopeptide (TPR) repeat protein
VRRLIVAVALVCGASSIAPVGLARGQDAPPSADEEARVRFAAGRLALAARRYDDALTDFERAYELSHRPALLFNLAHVHTLLAHREEALALYRRYLDEAEPSESDRARAEEQIAVLTASLAAAPLEATPPPASSDGDVPLHVRSAVDATPAWVVLGTGAGVLLVGAILGGLGLADRFAVEGASDGTRWESIQAAYDRGPTLEAVGDSLFAAGVVTIVVGAVWLATLPSSSATVDHAGRPSWRF